MGSQVRAQLANLKRAVDADRTISGLDSMHAKKGRQLTWEGPEEQQDDHLHPKQTSNVHGRLSRPNCPFERVAIVSRLVGRIHLEHDLGAQFEEAEEDDYAQGRIDENVQGVEGAGVVVSRVPGNQVRDEDVGGVHESLTDDLFGKWAHKRSLSAKEGRFRAREQLTCFPTSPSQTFHFLLGFS